LVIIVEDWDVIEDYAGEKMGFYQLLASDGMLDAPDRGTKHGLVERLIKLSGRCPNKRRSSAA
jgi:hypothetical protein